MSSTFHPRESSIRQHLKCFAQLWLEQDIYNKAAKSGYVLTARERDQRELDVCKSLRHRTDIKFYQLTEVPQQQATGDSGSDHWHKVAVTANTCLAGVFSTFKRLELFLKNVESGVLSVKSMRAMPRPRLLANRLDHLYPNTMIALHDFIEITFSNEEKFVVDFAGWQFGFQEWFFRLEDYEESCIEKGSKVETDIERNGPNFLSLASEEVQGKVTRCREYLESLSDAELQKMSNDTTV